MTEGGTRYRVSLLPFEDASRMWRAVAALFKAGFSPSQFGLLGTPSKFEDCRPPAAATLELSGALDGILTARSKRVTLAGSDVFEARCGTLAACLFAETESEISEPFWIRPDLASSLASDLANGCFVLLVTSTTAVQHALGAGLLLRYGDRNLQTHEFSMSHLV